MEIIVAIMVIGVAIFVWRSWRLKKRRLYLMEKYSDDLVVERILSKKIWQGMTDTQLIDSWGSPVERAHKIYKTKSTEIFKYSELPVCTADTGCR